MRHNLETMRLLISCFLFLTTTVATAQKGTISGKVVDAKTGETLIGVSVIVENVHPIQGAVTDFDGNFVIPDVTAGKHKVTLRYVGYAPKTLENVEVPVAGVVTLNTILETGDTKLKEVEITAKASRETQSAIFVMQKNSSIIQSGISSEDMKRSPDRSSSEVLRRVSGATIQDGKFAVIRGLADRYNMALLNNAILPATEPDRKAFAFDIFPSNILDNIIIMKTAQPDLPSEWAGGLIQLNTRDIPEKSFFNITIGQTFTEQSTFIPYYSYEGSKTDFLGFDNGTRILPKNFPSALEFNNKTSDVQRRQLGTSLLDKSWGVNKNKLAYPGQSLQLSGGYAWRGKDVQFGAIAALSYGNNLRYTSATRNRQDGDGSPYLSYQDKIYNNSVTSALIGNFSVVIKNKHRISWKNAYTINSDDNTVQRSGVSYFSSVETKRTNLEFISSRVYSTTLSGEHVFGKKEFKLRWNGGLVLMNRDQPQTRRYSYDRMYNADSAGAPNTNTAPFLLNLPKTGSDPKYGAMFYSKLSERIYNASVDFTAPFKIGSKKQLFKTGVYYQNRSRDFEARNLYVRKVATFKDSVLALPVDAIINSANMESGAIKLEQVAFPTDQYHAVSNTYAAYVMMENTASHWFKAVWGFRFEYFTQTLRTANKYTIDFVENPDGSVTQTGRFIDTSYTKNYFSGAYKTDSNGGNVKPLFPLLPSVNLIFKLNENMNFRTSYSQSMSRPEFREVAPFRYYDFVNEFELIGNENLLQTFIHNADLRYEWFMGKGQVVNASVFYKRFTNTIELAAKSGGGVDVYQYSNAEKADLIGAELEVRKNFAFITPKLEDLAFTANLAYIYSQVDLTNVKNTPADEMKRPMQGQSPYIINLGLSYQNRKIGFGANLLYNQTGDRLYATGISGNPAWYEHWRPLLDLQISQKFWKDRFTVRLTCSDLIAKPTIFYQNVGELGKNREYNKGKDYIVRQVNNYRSYFLQLSFAF